MCGIFFEICRNGATSECQKFMPFIDRRGPNFSKKISFEVDSNQITFYSSVLWLQGDVLSEQPFSRNNDCYLMWNGDVFNGANVFGMKWQEDQMSSDTDLLYHKLQETEDSEIPNVFAELEGPHAFLYFRKDKIWFGRDCLGRHSLLVQCCQNRFTVSSVSHGQSEFTELPALGIYETNINDLALSLHPWQHLPQDVTPPFDNLETLDRSLTPRICLPEFRQNSRLLPSHWFEGQADVLDAYLAKCSHLVDKLTALLSAAIKLRLETRPKSHQPVTHSLLFSGGLDSTVLAALTDKVSPECDDIELLNVAFENDKVGFEVPDRKTAKQALKELQSINPGRNFKLLEINVTKTQLKHWREKRIRRLLHPRDVNVLDDSIGCALWFSCYSSLSTESQPITELGKESRRRIVVLLGTGADEQLGGYSRHRVKFNEEGVEGLALELQAELARISERNMGRDNRVLADHGIAPRYPFLDESVVNFLSSLHPLDKSELGIQSRGLGEKILLRALAHRLGLRLTAREPKRAIQFGSKIAKMEGGRKEKGDHSVASRTNL